MPITVNVNSANPMSGVVTTATVYSSSTGATAIHRNGSDEAAVERGLFMARKMAAREAALFGPCVIEVFVNGDSHSTEIVGDYEETDITPDESDEVPVIPEIQNSDDEAVIEAKDIGTDLVAEVVAANEEAIVIEEELEVISGHEDVIEPAVEIEAPDVTLISSQADDRIELIIESSIDFELWRKIGSGKAATRKISAGTTEISYKGNIDEAEFRIDTEDGVVL